jgi:Flp pilus assembly protein TadD
MLAGVFLPVLIFAGCAPENKLPLTRSESQALADQEWVNGANRPPTPRTLLALSRVLVSQGREPEAQSVLYNVTRQHPNYPEAYVELAEIHMRNRRIDPAIKTLLQGLVFLPNDHVIVNDLGMCYLVRRDYKMAEEKFTAAAAIAPDNTRYRSNIALVLGLQGRYEESLSLYKQVTTESDAHFNLAVICDARKDSARAAEERKQVEMYEAQAVEKAAVQAAAETGEE